MQSLWGAKFVLVKTEAKAANSGHVGVTKNSNTELIKTKIA